MPFYEFECTQCRTRFEVFATIAQKAQGLAPRCPKCDSEQVRRVFDPLVLIQKGGDAPAPKTGGSCCGG